MRRIIFTIVITASLAGAYYAGAHQDDKAQYADLRAAWTHYRGYRGDFIAIGEGSGIGFRVYHFGGYRIIAVGRDHVVFQDTHANVTTIRPFSQLFIEIPRYNYTP